VALLNCCAILVNGRENARRIDNKAGVPTVDLETCVFCELVAGKRPISVIDETEDILAFMDIQPVNSGHVLIIPKRPSIRH